MELFLNNKPYHGKAAYINGYNGYNKTNDDATLCALINNSCWDSQGKPNYLKNKDGELIQNENLRGVEITID